MLSRRRLWLVTICSFVVADSVSTRAGLAVGAYESNPMMQHAVEAYGLPGMFSIKVLVLGIGYSISLVLDQRETCLWTFSAVGAMLTLWNVTVLLRLM